MKKDPGRDRRRYRQRARAAGAEATGMRILDAFGELLHNQWFEDVTLDAVAARARVTVRTVIRRFGGKSGLMAAFTAKVVPEVRRQVTPMVGNPADAVNRVLKLYEELGDGVMRNLAQESRVPELKPLLEAGRNEHRAITAEAFAPWLERLDARKRRRTLDGLVIATDVYTWQLLRRDMRRTREEARIVMLGLVHGVLTALRPPQGA